MRTLLLISRLLLRLTPGRGPDALVCVMTYPDSP